MWSLIVVVYESEIDQEMYMLPYISVHWCCFLTGEV